MKLTDITTPRNVAYVLLAIFAGIEIGLFLRDVPESNKDILAHSISTIENLLLIAAGYIFGSSLGSRAKDRPALDPGDGSVLTKQIETTNTQTEIHHETKPSIAPADLPKEPV